MSILNRIVSLDRIQDFLENVFDCLGITKKIALGNRKLIHCVKDNFRLCFSLGSGWGHLCNL